MNKRLLVLPLIAFIFAMCGSIVGSLLQKQEPKTAYGGLSPLPKFGPEGHPDTGDLIIVLCNEE